MFFQNTYLGVARKFHLYMSQICSIDSLSSGISHFLLDFLINEPINGTNKLMTVIIALMECHLL